jgi:hypothetical protein
MIIEVLAKEVLTQDLFGDKLGLAKNTRPALHGGFLVLKSRGQNV